MQSVEQDCEAEKNWLVGLFYTCPPQIKHGHALQIRKSQICCGQMLRQRWQFQDWDILWMGWQIWVRQDSALAVTHNGLPPVP